VFELLDAFEVAVVSFDAQSCIPSERERYAQRFARLANACLAASARAAAGSCGRPEELLARAAGTTVAAARSSLATVELVEECPATDAAVRSGEVSLAQAAEIVSVPGHESELLELARSSALGPVRDRARKRRLAAIDPAELYAAQRKTRDGQHWRDELGMVCLKGSLPPDVGIPFVNQWDAETDRLWREGRKNGDPEPRAAYAADALVRLVNGDAKAGKGRTDLVIVVDLNAYRRGHARDGEVAHIIGGGPIPIPVVRELAKDAFLNAVLHDGVAIHTIAHFGRKKPVHLMTALELGAPPDFEGVTCAAEGCERRYGLQWDHIDPVANGGPTTFENIQPLCGHDHPEKTERDRKAGLLRGRAKERGP
jgi:HNH endonuclease/Domain of unknown function (DUF222)